MGKGLLVSKVLPGQLNDLLERLMKATGVDSPGEAVRLINSGKYTVTMKKKPEAQLWRQGKDGVIYFNLTSFGYSGQDWIARLGLRRRDYGSDTARLLASSDFACMPAGVVTKVAILPAEALDKLLKRRCTVDDAKSEARKRKWFTLVPGAACQICEKLGTKQLQTMDLKGILVLHESVRYFAEGADDMDPGGETTGRLKVLLDHGLSAIQESVGFDQEEHFCWAQSKIGFAFAVSHKQVLKR